MKTIKLNILEKNVMFDLSSMNTLLLISGDVSFNGHRATSSSGIFKFETIDIQINDAPQRQICSQICYKGDSLYDTETNFNKYGTITLNSIDSEDEYEENLLFGDNPFYDSIISVIHSVIAPNIDMPVKWVEKIAQEYVNLATATHKK